MGGIPGLANVADAIAAGGPVRDIVTITSPFAGQVLLADEEIEAEERPLRFFVRGSTYTLLGLFEDLSFRSVHVTLAPDDVLVLFTDGANAVHVISAGQDIVLDVPKVPVADTVGAGDSFLGAMLFAERSIDPQGDAFAPRASALPGSEDERQFAERGYLQTEIWPFFLFALTGMLAFPAANDLLMMFVALEVMSLPLYLLAGMARRRRLLSQEAALKYFLLGVFASAVMLYGMSLLYGLSGSTKLTDIAAKVTDANLNSFHFHGDLDTYPVSAAIVLPPGPGGDGAEQVTLSGLITRLALEKASGAIVASVLIACVIFASVGYTRMILFKSVIFMR